MGNHHPEVRDGGPAFWRRVRLIPFDHVVPEHRRDAHLAEKLVSLEGAQILGWLVEGAVRSIHDGIGEPAPVITATAAYRMEEDVVATFVDDECRRGPASVQGYTVPMATVRDAFGICVPAKRRGHDVGQGSDPASGGSGGHHDPEQFDPVLLRDPPHRRPRTSGAAVTDDRCEAISTLTATRARKRSMRKPRSNLSSVITHPGRQNALGVDKA